MQEQYKIGYSNLTEKMSFSIGVRESLEVEAAKHPNVTLIVRDNDQNDEKALAITNEFAEIPVDLAIIYHINERIGPQLVQGLRTKRIPIISVEVAIPFTVFLGINNQQAGTQSGKALGEWIQKNWNGQVDRLLILADYRLTGLVRKRLEFASNAMCSVLGTEIDPFFIDSGNIRERSAETSYSVLKNWNNGEKIAIIGQNDDTTLGAVDAARRLGMESNVAGVGYGATEIALEELKNPASSLVASVDMHPAKYGEPLLNLALRMLRSEKVPPINLIEPRCLTAETLDG